MSTREQLDRMPKYAVLLHGKGLMLLNQDGEGTRGGVYSWRCVEAENEQQAFPLARQKLLADASFIEEVWNEPDDPPEIVVEETEQLEDAVDLAEADSACVFYYDDESALPFGAPRSGPSEIKK